MEITPEVDMSDYDRFGCLHEMFKVQAQRTPNSVAICTADKQQITFGELDEMSDVLAATLQKNGVTLNTVVGILMERCPEYVVAVISIHKAGGAYLPLEVSYPQNLLDSVLKDSRPIVVLTKLNFTERFSKYSNNNNSKNYTIIKMDNWKLIYTNQYKQNLASFKPIKVQLDDMAYTVYSSGTTGKPKGIQCPHRGAVFSYTWRHKAYPYGSDDREACNVFFVWEMLRPLLKGMPLYVIPDDVIYDPPRLAEFIRQFKITRMLFTPSLMQAVLEFQGLDLKNSFKSFREIIFCGEVVTTALRDRVANLLPWIRLLNLYSISECHDVANSDISKPNCGEPRKFCPVGKIFPLVHIVVMDEEKNVKNVGEPGEIFVGGPTLAIGYLNRPDLNAERFIERPQNVDPKVGPRLYRTGDWGFMLADGSLEICGRCDTAVRIRGYNVELQAIERTLLDAEEVNACCVLAHGEEGSEKYVVAFIVLDNEFTKSKEEKNVNLTRNIRIKLKDRLPNYMIPSQFIYLDKIPILEASGKLDKKALIQLTSDYQKQFDANNKSKKYEGLDLTETQLKIALIWENILNVFFAIDVNENFFDLGGHSLAATRLISEINEEFKMDFDVRTVFQNPTIAELSSVIDGNESNSVRQLDLNEELKLHSLFLPQHTDLDKRLSAFWKLMKLNEKKLCNGSVLLTGATGFLGSHLLHELIIKSQCTVYVLVRDKPGMSALERIVEAQKIYGLPPLREDLINERRIIPLKGDVSLLNLGLPDDVYQSLTYEVDMVLHASAQVNLVLPYTALFKDNVIGTKNVILFALTNKIKYLNYISSNAVFPDNSKNCKEDDDMSNYVNQLNVNGSGYSQTKWLAEQLITKAGQLGLPYAIYRCGNVGGSTEKPCWNPSDFILYMIQGVLITGLAPDIKWKVELAPVEFVRKVIVKLSQDLNSSVGRIFHVINNQLPDCSELWSTMNDFGYNIKTNVKYNDWLIAVSQNELLQKLHHILLNTATNEDYFSNLSDYNRVYLDKYLEKNNLIYPHVNRKLFLIYLRHLSEINLIPSSPIALPIELDHQFYLKNIGSKLSSNQSLEGKIVFLTGGSSGIGSAIAIGLCFAKAKVAIAARRIDRLNAIKQYLVTNGCSDVITCQVDITNTDQVKMAVKEVESKWGPIDILINNAGCMYYQLMKHCNLSEWQHMVQLNCVGTLNCLSVILESMVKRKSGHVIMITSDAGRKAFPGLAVYSGTKFFLEGLSSALRMELSTENIKVTCIQPGDVESELHYFTTDLEASEKYDLSKSIKILKPFDITQAVIYALTQPEYCAVNEILIEPQEAPI